MSNKSNIGDVCDRSLTVVIRRLFGAGLLLSAMIGFCPAVVAQDFSSYYDLINQVRVISPNAGSKSSIGSGFQVNQQGLIITNFHVVSSYINAPKSHEIHYLNQQGETGRLELLDFDVINDLAVLRHPQPANDFFTITEKLPRKGDMTFALGNPRDYGITLVPGPNNGLVEHSYDAQILFSGSLNPGMSGGPALNAQGEVVGVNVATAGSQLSFLVPAKKINNLLARNRHIEASDYQREIADQIKLWQRNRIQELIDMPWKPERFGNYELFGEVRNDFQCWGDTNVGNKARTIESISKSCVAGNHLYLARNLTAGHILFSFEQKTALKLNAFQFHRTINTNMSADNRSNFDHSSNYQCQVDFVEGSKAEDQEAEDGKRFNRVTLCVRAYKKLKGLFDSLLLIEKSQNKEVLSVHVSLSAIEKDQIHALNRKVMEAVL
ncbi:MAG: S1 family peptidase [Arenicella sp.]